MTSYIEYYELAKQNFKSERSKFWIEPNKFHEFKFNLYYRQSIERISNVVLKYFGNNIIGNLSIEYKDDIFSIGLQEVANNIVPVLEHELYGCHLFVDKIYIYRSVFTAQPSKSWLFHWDNNPPTVYKTMIYLTDVNSLDNAPFQWLDMPIMKPTRLGPEKWEPPPNNSRLTEEQIKGKKVNSVFGSSGTTFIFNPNCAHRATIPTKNNYRDVLVLRTRPTIEPVDEYISPLFTTTFGVTGAVPRNPFIKKCAQGA